LNHAVQHLCGNNYRFLVHDGLSYQVSLYDGDLFRWNFYSQITAGDHNSIRMFKDFIYILYPFNVFYFRNDFNGAFVFIEKIPDCKNILFVSYKGMGNKINLILCREPDEAFIFIR